MAALLAGVGVIAMPFSALAQTSSASVAALARLSIEELANITVTSVSKRAQPLNQAPATIFVITQDDISRSSATSIPELLRLAPNLQVAQLSASSYGISARGFNHSTGTANKLQVLVDGRVAYSPLFSGVFWDEQNTMLEDLDRIEVISGPAGTLWGSNAVNGVINITSRSSRDTQGDLFTVRAGSEGDGMSARHGGTLAANMTYRVYATGLYDRNTARVDGLLSRDGWDNAQGGFRVDWGGITDTLTLQGDIYNGKTERVPGAVANGEIGGQNIQAKWSSQMSDTSSFSGQIYYDNARRDLTSGIRASVDAFDIDGQYGFALGTGQNAVIGAGYRVTQDTFIGGPGTSFLNPGSRTLALANIFAQDIIDINAAVSLTLGLKLEHNSYTGLEYMPDGRLAWRVSDTDTLWASVSRAVRTPSRFDTQLFATGTLAGGPNFESEDLVALEAGYRGQPVTGLSFSISTYFNIYDNLRTVEASTARIFPLIIANNMRGNTYGVEAWGSYAFTDWWRIKLGANAMRKELELVPGNRDIFGVKYAGNDPSYQFQLQSDFDLSPDVALDFSLRDVDALASPAVPAYVEADARINWRVVEHLQLSLAGSNLLHDKHQEFTNASLPPLAIPRSVTLSARLDF